MLYVCPLASELLHMQFTSILQPLQQNFLKENTKWRFLNHKRLETGDLKKIKIVRVDNCALGSPQLIWKATVTAKIWLEYFRLESWEVTALECYDAC